MNLKHRHIIIGIGLLLCGLLGFVACTNETPEFPREEDDGNHIFLTFQATLAGASTRAGEEPVADDRVKTLRIVIVSQGKEEGTENAAWVVEHNKTVSWGSQLSNKYTFEVAPDSRKRIYLIANESNDNENSLVGADGKPLDFTDKQFIPDDTGRVPVDNYVFDVSTLNYSYTPSALPMTALYEIDVPPLNKFPDGKLTYPDPLYLVRAATKFSFKFTNQSKKRNITVTGIDINGVITDQMYLMPHVNKKDDKYWVVEETETNGNVTYTPLDLEKDWIDWMGYEANASQSGTDNKWLTDYKVPTSATTETVKVTTSLKMQAATDAQPSPSVEASNAIYLPESKTVKGESNPLELQEYSITVYTEEQTVGGTEKEVKTYPSKTLPHLASLFRNTHVVVGFIFTEDADELVVDVIPFTPVELKPDYGLEREEFTGYIIGKDKEGRKCWYDGNYYDPETAVPLYLGPSSNPESFVTINGKEYLLVYADYERTAANLDHFFEKESRKKYLLYPAGRTGYENVNWTYYLNDLKQRVWLDEDYMEWNVVWNPNFEVNGEVVGRNEWVYTPGKWYRTLNEWDRLDWNKAVYDKLVQDPKIYPKYWFDILGNRYPWSVGDTKEKRAAILGEWVQYLE